MAQARGQPSAPCDHAGLTVLKSRRLQVARALLELACLRWRRWGACECAAFASRARPAPTLLEQACLRWRQWGVSEFAAFASRASPAPTGWRGLCWSWLACDGVGAVSVSSRRLHRGQDPLLQLARVLLEQACLRWRRRGACECAASASRARPAPTLLELACLRWPRRGVREFAAPASRASPAPTAGAGSVGAGLPAMASEGFP